MRLRWTPEAADDLENVLAYIAARNPAAAASVAERIDAAIAIIKQWPYAARHDEETGAREAVVRGLPLLIVYTVSETLIEVIAVFRTSRDPRQKRRPRR